MGTKARVSGVASRFALTSVLEQVGTRRPGLVVLVYHRILEPRDSRFDPNVIEATPEQFDDQMRMLKKRHHVVTPSELCELIERPSSIRHLHVAITFDDGYRDNYKNAFPILKSHGLSAMFFLPTHFVGSSLVPWWDQVARMVRSTAKSSITLEYPKPLTVAIDPNDVGRSIQKVLHTFTLSSNNDQSKFLESVAHGCGVELSDHTEGSEFLSWDEAREMHDAGMAIASHAHSHRILSNLTEDEQLEEVKRAYDELDKRGFPFAKCLAYPVGHPYSFSKRTIACAKEVGYTHAFSNYGGLNERGSIDPFDIRRYAMALDLDVPQMRLRLALGGLAHRDFW